MDITLLSLIFFILCAITFLLLFLFRSINTKSFKASDGSVFQNQLDLDIYQRLYKKTKPLFSVLEGEDSCQDLLGFDKLFLTKLTTKGFQDLKIIIKYRRQFKLLSDLINT